MHPSITLDLWESLAERIIEPLKLKNTIALMAEQNPPGLIKGHTNKIGVIIVDIYMIISITWFRWPSEL